MTLVLVTSGIFMSLGEEGVGEVVEVAVASMTETEIGMIAGAMMTGEGVGETEAEAAAHHLKGETSPHCAKAVLSVEQKLNSGIGKGRSGKQLRRLHQSQ